MDEENIKPDPPSMDWLLTFADLISLLITFFVLLYSMKEVDTQHWDELKGTFSGVFSIRDPIYESKPNNDTSLDKAEQVIADNLDYVLNILKGRFRKNEILSNSKIKNDRVGERLLVTLSSDNIFKDAGMEVSEKGREAIAMFGDVFRHLDNRLVIAVHTDLKVLEDTEAYPSNWEFSMLRAIKLVNIFAEQGVQGHVQAMAYGSSRFAETNENLPIAERNKAARWVEIAIYSDMDNWEL